MPLGAGEKESRKSHFALVQGPRISPRVPWRILHEIEIISSTRITSRRLSFWRGGRCSGGSGSEDTRRTRRGRAGSAIRRVIVANLPNPRISDPRAGTAVAVAVRGSARLGGGPRACGAMCPAGPWRPCPALSPSVGRAGRLPGGAERGTGKPSGCLWPTLAPGPGRAATAATLCATQCSFSRLNAR